MSNKLRKYEEKRLDAEENINAEIISNSIKEKDKKSLLRLGAIGAIGRLAQNLNAQTIRALQSIRDSKDFEALGFSRFDDFLNESDVSPMSYRQFIDREKLLLSEGDHIFDLMNSLKLSNKQRRLLGAGHVQIDESKGTVLIVTSSDTADEEVEEIELTDRTRLLQTLSALADQNALLNLKANKQSDKIERGEREVEKLKKKLDDAMNRPGEVKIIDLFLAVCKSLRLMAAMVRESSDAEKQHGRIYMDSIDEAVQDVKSAYNLGNSQPVSAAKRKKQTSSDSDSDDLSEITSTLTDEELAGLMEQ